MDYPLYNLKNEKIGDVKLSDDVFNVAENNDLMHQVLTSQAANSRRSIAHAKDRSEVRGGGVKPWRQKGTGRARHASIRSPIWVGGGVTFGPKKERNFSRFIPKKMKQKALKITLSDKAKRKMLKIVDKLEIQESKTKTMSGLLLQLFKGSIEKIRKNSNFVLVLTGENKLSKNIAFANRNIPYSKTLRAKNLNPLDAASYKHILLDKEALKVIEDRFVS